MSRTTRLGLTSKMAKIKELSFIVEVNAEGDEMVQDSLKGFNVPAMSVQPDMKYNRKFFIGSENLLASGGAVYCLQHPRTSTKAYYYIDLNAGVQELILIENSSRSFFFGNSVISEGSFTLLAAVHPLFLMLGYLMEKARNRYVTLDDCIEGETSYPAIRLLVKNKKLLLALKIAAKFKELDNELYYRYDEDCLMKWLEKRFNILMTSLVKNSNLNKNILSDEDVLRRYIFGMMCDYLPESVSLILKSHLKIKDPENFVQPARASKRSAVEKEDEQQNELVKKVQRVSKAVKQLKKASKGTRGLASFFSKPF